VTDGEPIVAVVDDDLSIRRSLERLLRAAGYRVKTFASAREFLERGASDRPDCAVLDVRMPGQSGLDLHGKLAAAGGDIPAIFISGDADFPMADRAKKAGATDFLPKPFDASVLLSAIERAIARGRQRQKSPPAGP
jgi:FixJ family two-component response regulator